MDIIQKFAVTIVFSMVIYAIIINLRPSVSTSTPQIPSPVSRVVTHVTNLLPESLQSISQVEKPEIATIGDASNHPGSSIYPSTDSANPLPVNQDLFDKPVDFGSDVTNINQFYKNNPEIFGKILGNNNVTNVADWEQKSKEMFKSQEQAGTGPVQAYNSSDMHGGSPY